MHIAFFIPSFAAGGAQRMVINMANEFAARGHSVDLLVAESSGPFSSRVLPKVNVIDLGATRVLRSLVPLVKYIKARKPNIVLSAMFHINIITIFAKLAAGSIQTKFVLTERNFFSLRTKARTHAREIFFPFLVRVLYRYADQIIAISRGVADDIATVSKVPRERISWIHNPVISSHEHHALDQNIPDPWFDSINAPVIVSSGRLVQQKDHATLLKSFALANQCRNLYLLILGDGPLMNSLTSLASDLNIANRVHFVGYVDNPIAYMKRCDVFVMSSKWEGFGNVIVEALLCGLPVVATDCHAGPAEILQNGKYGSLVPVGDVEELCSAILKQLDSRPKHEVLEQRAIHFSVRNVCNEYEKIFEALVCRSSASY